MFARLALILGLIPFFPCISFAADTIVGWRTDARGSYASAQPPTRWSPTENIVWKTALPGKSWGSPILVGEHLFVPSDPAELLCLKASDGEIVWRKTNSAAEVFGAKRVAEIETSWGELNTRKRTREREFDEFRKANPDAKEEHEKFRNEVRDLERQLDELKLKNPIYADRGSGNSSPTPVSDGKHGPGSEPLVPANAPLSSKRAARPDHPAGANLQSVCRVVIGTGRRSTD